MQRRKQKPITFERIVKIYIYPLISLFLSFIACLIVKPELFSFKTILIFTIINLVVTLLCVYCNGRNYKRSIQFRTQILCFLSLFAFMLGSTLVTHQTQNEIVKLERSLKTAMRDLNLREVNMLDVEKTFVSPKHIHEKITVSNINVVSINNESIVYIQDTMGRIFKQNSNSNKKLHEIKAGDVITIQYTGLLEIKDVI